MKGSIVFLYIIAVILIVFGFLYRSGTLAIETLTPRKIMASGFIIYVITKYFIAKKE